MLSTSECEELLLKMFKLSSWFHFHTGPNASTSSGTGRHITFHDEDKTDISSPCFGELLEEFLLLLINLITDLPLDSSDQS